MCVFSLLHWPAVPPSFSFSLCLPIPWDTHRWNLGQLITLPWPVSVQVEGRILCLSLFFFFFFFFNGHTGYIWKSLGQGLNPSHSCNNAGSFNSLSFQGWNPYAPAATQATAVRFLTHCATVGTPCVSHFIIFLWFLFFPLWLVYSGLSVSTVQQSDPVTHIYTFLFSHYPPSCSIISD